MVRCCHISRRLTHAVASIKTGFWRERKKERATTERQKWVREWVSWGWAWAWSWSMIAVMIPSFSCAPSHCLSVFVCTCLCVCVSLVVGSAFFVKYVHWPLPNFQFFLLFIYLVSRVTYTYIHIPYTDRGIFLSFVQSFTTKTAASTSRRKREGGRERNNSERSVRQAMFTQMTFNLIFN